jgi:hypothetical protein
MPAKKKTPAKKAAKKPAATKKTLKPRKVYELPGQKKDTPPELNSLRM